MQISTLMDQAQLAQTIDTLAKNLMDTFKTPDNLVLIGIRTRGVFLAARLKESLAKQFGYDIPLGALDITLYRDDLSQLASQPLVKPSDIPFDLSGKNIILVDDVLYTGRTVRAALDQMIVFGRPRVIRLLVIIDRGWREYPIQPDFVGQCVETTLKQIVEVRLTEVDGDEGVLLVTRD